MSASRSVPRPAPECSSAVITRPSAPSRNRTPTRHRLLRRAAQRGHPARSRRGTPREPSDRPEAEHEESVYINSPLTFGATQTATAVYLLSMGVIHPIPGALTESHDQQKGRLAQRSAVHL